MAAKGDGALTLAVAISTRQVGYGDAVAEDRTVSGPSVAGMGALEAPSWSEDASQ